MSDSQFISRHPDPLDQASALSLHLADAAVDAARRLSRPEQEQNPDGTWPQTECEDCGEDIEPGRLAMGRIRCLACQTALEHRNKQRR